MKKILIMCLIIGCIGVFAMSLCSFAATLFDVTVYNDVNLNQTTYLGTRTYKYDDLGVDWRWTSNTTYYDGGYAKFQYKGFLGIYSDKTSQGWCAANLPTTYCLRWVDANNDTSQTLRVKIEPHLVSPPPGGSTIYMHGYTTTLSEE